MNLEFTDYNVNKKPNQTFTTVDELRTFLRQLKGEEPSAGLLVGDNGYHLTFAIDGDLAFAEISTTDLMPPYLAAKTHKPICDETHVFWVTGHHTEITSDRCLTFDEFETVVTEFFQTGKRSSLFEWLDA